MRPINLNAAWQNKGRAFLVYKPAIQIAGVVSKYFILFTIMLNTNLHLDYLDWLKLMRKAKAKTQIIEDGCFGNNEHEYKQRVDDFAANPGKWGCEVIKGDR